MKGFFSTAIYSGDQPLHFTFYDIIQKYHNLKFIFDTANLCYAEDEEKRMEEMMKAKNGSGQRIPSFRILCRIPCY